MRNHPGLLQPEELPRQNHANEGLPLNLHARVCAHAHERVHAHAFHIPRMDEGGQGMKMERKREGMKARDGMEETIDAQGTQEKVIPIRPLTRLIEPLRK